MNTIPGMGRIEYETQRSTTAVGKNKGKAVAEIPRRQSKTKKGDYVFKCYRRKMAFDLDANLWITWCPQILYCTAVGKTRIESYINLKKTFCDVRKWNKKHQDRTSFHLKIVSLSTVLL